MIEKLLSAHISAEGDVVAITEGYGLNRPTRTWLYGYRLTEVQQKKLLSKLAVAGEIDTKYWIEEINIGTCDE